MSDDEPVPKIPYGRGFKWTWPQIVKIVMTLGMLVAVLVLAKPCANAVSSFVMRFDDKGSAAKQMPKPETVKQPDQYELIRGDMTEEERRAAIERAKARAAGSAAGSGSATGSGSGTGTGTGSGSGSVTGSGSASGSGSAGAK